jgi:hypothetical protein
MSATDPAAADALSALGTAAGAGRAFGPAVAERHGRWPARPEPW